MGSHGSLSLQGGCSARPFMKWKRMMPLHRSTDVIIIIIIIIYGGPTTRFWGDQEDIISCSKSYATDLST